MRRRKSSLELEFRYGTSGCDDGIAFSGKVDDHYRVEGLVAAGAIGGVDVKCSPDAPPPMAMVNVPEDVKTRARVLRCGTQLLATDAAVQEIVATYEYLGSQAWVACETGR